jgi:thiosulfate/3-mercaptopyruvate sulfurtransferase
MSTRQEHTSFSSYLVTPKELHAALKHNPNSSLSTSPKVVPLCGSWFLPNDPAKRTGRQVFEQDHIPNARFFDLDAVSDTSSPYPHMLPSAETFAEAVGKAGIRAHDTVVVYDSAELGIFSAPRVAWTFKIFGHPAVHILNNFKLWVEAGLPVVDGKEHEVDPVEYATPELDKSKVASFEEMVDIAKEHNKEGHEEFQVIDARSAGRWKGTEPEPRPGLSSGHMPGSTSLPVPLLLDPTTKAFLPSAELRRIFKEKGVDPSKPIVSSCGTGVTAAVIDAALTEAGYASEGRRIYDGSWTEWAMRVKPQDSLIVKET